MTPGGVTSGPGTLIHDMLVSAGYANFQQAPGWRALPLERLASTAPDHVAAAFYEDGRANPYYWSASRHATLRKTLRLRPVTTLNGAWTACGAWFLIDAVEALAEAAP